MICFNCKTQLEEGSLFCTECGAKQPQAAPPVAPSAPLAADVDDLDATIAAPFGKMQEDDLDATQVMDSYPPVQNYPPQREFEPNQGYQQQNYGFVPPVPPVQPPMPPAQPEQPPKKKGKGVLIAVICIVAAFLLIGVIGVICIFVFFAGEIFDKNDEDITTTAAYTEESTTEYYGEYYEPEVTEQQITVPQGESFTGGFVPPTAPQNGSDFNPNDIFGTTRPNYEPPTDPPVYNSDRTETPETIADSDYVQAVLIEAYVYDEYGEATLGEYGYFYKDGNACLYVAEGNESVVIETDSETDYITVYYSDGNGYEKVTMNQTDSENTRNGIVYHLVQMGLDKDYFYPELTYEYVGDSYDDTFGTVQVYDVYDGNSFAGTIIVDESTGYYTTVWDENDNFLYLVTNVYTTGYGLPLNFR